MSQRVKILPNEHVFVAGRTGSGKTFLTRQYLAGFPHVAVLDSKGEFVWPESPEAVTAQHLSQLGDIEAPHIIYKPVWEELEAEYFDAFFQWAYRRRNTTVSVDEAMEVSPNPHVIPRWYKAILTRGRELGVGVWSCSQRPSGLAQVIMSEATHFFIFDLNMPQDRRKLVEITGQPELHELPGPRNFWYYRVGQDSPILATLKVTRQGG